MQKIIIIIISAALLFIAAKLLFVLFPIILVGILLYQGYKYLKRRKAEKEPIKDEPLFADTIDVEYQEYEDN